MSKQKNTGKVTGKFSIADGSTTTFTFTPSTTITRDPDGGMVALRKVVARLDSDGFLIDSNGDRGVILTATHRTGLEANDWYWHVSSNLDGWREFDFILRSGETLDLVAPKTSSITGKCFTGESFANALKEALSGVTINVTGNAPDTCNSENTSNVENILSIIFDNKLPDGTPTPEGGVTGVFFRNNIYMSTKDKWSYWNTLGIKEITINGTPVPFPENTVLVGAQPQQTFGSSAVDKKVFEADNWGDLVKFGRKLRFINKDTSEEAKPLGNIPQGAIVSITPKIYYPEATLEENVLSLLAEFEFESLEDVTDTEGINIPNEEGYTHHYRLNTVAIPFAGRTPAEFEFPLKDIEWPITKQGTIYIYDQLPPINTEEHTTEYDNTLPRIVGNGATPATVKITYESKTQYTVEIDFYNDAPVESGKYALIELPETINSVTPLPDNFNITATVRRDYTNTTGHRCIVVESSQLAEIPLDQGSQIPKNLELMLVVDDIKYPIDTNLSNSPFIAVLEITNTPNNLPQKTLQDGEHIQIMTAHAARNLPTESEHNERTNRPPTPESEIPSPPTAQPTEEY